MTIWVLHQTLTPEEEDNIEQRAEVTLPFDGLPDLSKVSSQAGFMHMLRMLHPDAPPETIAKLVDQTWTFYSALHEEDILVVPLQARKEVAIAEVTGKYRHEIGAKGEDLHMLPVTWHKRVAFSKFRKMQDVFQERRHKRAYEIENQHVRIIIRDRMPHSYNRFAGLKWLLIVFFAWRLFAHLSHMASSGAEPPSFP